MRFVGVERQRRDLWVGLYIGPEKYPMEGGCSRKFYLCLVPTLALVFERRYNR